MPSSTMTIFRLKSGSSVDSSLHVDGNYDEAAVSPNAPEGCRLFVRRGASTTPWWITFFDAQADIKQQMNSGVAFIPAGDSLFAICFGHGRALLVDSRIDHDFGTRVVLNMLDPRKLKSTDTLTPASSQRRHTQLPFDSDLALLSFAEDESVLRSIQGKVKDEFKELASNVTGSQSVRISTPAQLVDLTDLLETLQQLSQSSDYKATFPELGKITPVSDLEMIERLDSHLIDAIYDKTALITLIVPDVVDEKEDVSIQFSGAGGEEFFEDVYIKQYREHLEARGLSRQDLTSDKLQKHSLRILGPEMDEIDRVSMYNSLVFSVDDVSGEYTFHFDGGVWFRITTELVSDVRDYLDSFWVESRFPSYNHATEGAYNEFLAKELGMPCLDATNMSPSGLTQLEPCDVFHLDDRTNEYIHVKIGTGSSTLSHLFNQGLNSIELLRSNLDARKKFLALLEERSNSNLAMQAIDNITGGRNEISFVIATHKRSPERRSDLLPFFSRLSLRRQLRALESMGVAATFQFVLDETDRAGRKKPRKRTKAQNGAK